MFNNKKFYRIRLEDYSQPRHTDAVRSYYGEMDDMIAFANGLDTNPGTSKRYHQIIDGIEFYDLDLDITHTVAGHEYRLLDPVVPLAYHELYLENQRWVNENSNGILYPMSADIVWVARMLFRHEDGTIVLCMGAIFENLRIGYQNSGWCKVPDKADGFPGTVTCSDGRHYLNFFVEEASYSPDDMGRATEDLLDQSTIDLSIAGKEILGQG